MKQIQARALLSLVFMVYMMVSGAALWYIVEHWNDKIITVVGVLSVILTTINVGTISTFVMFHSIQWIEKLYNEAFPK